MCKNACKYTYVCMNGWISAVQVYEVVLFSYQTALRNIPEYNNRLEHIFILNRRLMEFSVFML